MLLLLLKFIVLDIVETVCNTIPLSVTVYCCKYLYLFMDMIPKWAWSKTVVLASGPRGPPALLNLVFPCSNTHVKSEKGC